MSAQKYLLFVGALVAAGCTGMNNSTTLDEMGNSTGKGQGPYVEAFIEYQGPHSRWIGPGNFTLHVNAREPEHFSATFTPDLFAREKGVDSLSERTLANASPHGPVRGRMTSEDVRSEIAELAAAVQSSGSAQKFSGCLSPVRVRLVRADGALLERQGCRSNQGWVRIAGEMVHGFAARRDLN